MGWSSDEEVTTKKGMDTSTKIIFAIIACVFFIIVLIMVLLVNIEMFTFTISVNGQEITTTNKNLIMTEIEGVTYFNIEEVAKLVKYEYHEGEYKAFTIEKDKCYVQGANETATFYLNDNKVCKLPVNKLEEAYREFSLKNTVKQQNGKMYATIDAIQLAFNIYIEKDNNSISIYNLDELIKTYDARVKQLGYSGILDQTFENQKSLLYGYLIVKKEKGLYKIINIDNTKEIVADKYTSIEFSENTQEFLVKNSLGQVGIITLNGTTKIEPIYDSISVLDKKEGLYIVQKNEKYGIIKSGNITVIDPEYDDIGINIKNKSASSENEEPVIVEEKQYIILDDLIPVYKDKKWGVFDKTGKEVIKVEYDGFGCNITTIEINGVSKEVKPVFEIERCNGIVVRKLDKYGIIDKNGKELVQLQVDNIYEILNPESEDKRYYMVYNNKEYNVIEKLMEAGILKDKTTDTTSSTSGNNKIENNSITTNLNNISNTISSNIIQ